MHPKDAGGVLVELVEPARRTEPHEPSSHSADPGAAADRYIHRARPDVPGDDVKQILDAILAGDATADDFAALAGARTATAP